jgi:hypothetical protein
MPNVIVFCGGTVDQTTVAQGAGTAYVATCSQAWQAMPAPSNTLDAEEFAGFFFGVLVSTLTFYFVGVLPLGAFLRFVRQGIRNLL